jgi:hypothetical protein
MFSSKSESYVSGSSVAYCQLIPVIIPMAPKFPILLTVSYAASKFQIQFQGLQLQSKTSAAPGLSLNHFKPVFLGTCFKHVMYHEFIKNMFISNLTSVFHFNKTKI